MRKSKRQNNQRYIPFVLFFLICTLYCFFVSRTVYGGDSGDFLAAIAVRGVPHPSGYPLYTLLGIILSYIPFPASLAWKVGVGSAIFSAASVFLTYLITLRLLGSVRYAIITSLTLAFSYPFWLYAETTEVLALQHLFISLLVYLSLLYYQTKRVRLLFFTAFFYGLSLTNNQTMLLMAPILVIVCIKNFFAQGNFIKNFLVCCGFFILGLLPYLYIPIAASFHPPVNWNNPTTFDSFMHLVLRKDYGWTATTVIRTDVRFLIVKNYFNYFISEMTILGIGLFLLGVAYSLIRKKPNTIAFSFLAGFILFGPFFIYYGAGPIFDTFSQGVREKFYGGSLLFFIFLLPYGFEAVRRILGRLFSAARIEHKRSTLYQQFIIFFFFILPLILFFKNVSILDLRNVTIPGVFAYELLAELPKNTVLIAQHDNVHFPVWYEQFANGFRNDVFATTPKEFERLANAGMLHLSSPSAHRPDNLDSKIDSIAFSLSTPVIISETDYRTVATKDTVFLYPYGLGWKYATPSETHIEKDVFLKKQNALLAQLSNPNTLFSSEQKERLWLLSNFPLFYAHAYSNTGYFLMYAYQDYALARTYFEKAVTIDDQDDWGYEGLGISYYKEKNFKKAKEAFASAVAIQPLNHNAYYLLYGTTLALKDTEATHDLESFFKQYYAIYTEFNYGHTRVKLPQ